MNTKTGLQKGMVYVFTGEGKGKTSAGMWTGVRAALSGMKVAVICWYKEARWPTADQRIGGFVPGMKVYVKGKGFYKLPTDHTSEEGHREAANEGLRLARRPLSKVDVLVLDEINNAVGDGLVSERDVVELIEKRGGTHLVLTGRGAGKKVVGLADLVTEMRKIKHPFDRGLKAIKGLDY